MNKSQIPFLLFSLCWLGCSSCASDYRYMQSVETRQDCIGNVAPVQFETSWYHANVDVVGNHISGLLLIKKMPDDSYRIVFTNEAGVTFFDFGFSKEGTFAVYNVINKLDRGPVIRTLQKDFELILGLPFRNASYETWSMNDEVFYGTRQKNGTSYFITTKDCASLRRLELGSARKRIITVEVMGQGYPKPDKLELKHYTFNMRIKLTRFDNE